MIATHETLAEPALVGKLKKSARAPARQRGHNKVRQAAASELGEPKPASRQRKPWKPGGRDELVYEWVRFQGKTQDWVASALDISQTTVSRILQRYEKWKAHAQPGQDGSLDRAERQRMQWWLTYERNERILASSLRMAHDMEFPRDTSKSVTRRPTLATSDEQEIRTEHSVLDRSGMASRFLRLAFRINMEQMKLVDREPEQPLSELTGEELAVYESESDAVEAEIKAARQRREDAEALRHRFDSEIAAAAEAEVRRRLDAESKKAEEQKEATDETRRDTDGKEDNVALAVAQDQSLTLKLHKVHNRSSAENGASVEPGNTCAAIGEAKGILRQVHEWHGPEPTAASGTRPKAPEA